MSSDAPGPAPVPMPNPLYTLEHSLYVGNYMSGMIYMASILLYLGTMRRLLWRKGAKQLSAKSRRFYAIYTTIMFVMLTMDVIINAIWCELAWVNGRDHPGGTLGYIVENLAVWYQTMGGVTVIVMIFMGDALLLRRLYIFCGQKKLVLVVPILAYLAAFSLAICQTVVAAAPGSASLFGGKAINFGVPYYTITIALNVTVTSVIIWRLRHLSSQAVEALGREHTQSFTGFSAVLIESAAIYSIFGFMFLVPYATGSQSAIAFGQVWAKLTCVCPQMIVYRIVAGKAWDQETIYQVTTAIGTGTNPATAAAESHANHSSDEKVDEEKGSI